MKESDAQRSYEWHQDHLPGGPGDDQDAPEGDEREVHEERKERLLEMAIERQERRGEE